jgi:hypothetical protein
MPVNNFQQARIDLSKAQARAIAELFKNTMSTATISLEETNVPNCVAVIKQNSVTLVHHGGEVHKIGASTTRPQAAKKKAR